MSLADRLAHVNLVVESFLTEHNAAHLVDAWHELHVQCTVFEGLGVVGESGKRPQLKVVFDNTARGVAPHITKVLLGTESTGFTNDTLQLVVPDTLPLHVQVKRHGQRRWKLSAVGWTLVRVGSHLPSSLLVEPTSSLIDRPGVVLQRTSVFVVGSHVFEVVNAPALLKRHRGKLLAAGTRYTLECTDVTSVGAEIQESDSAACVLRCVSPPDSPVFQRQWVVQYNKGNTVWHIGTSKHTSIQLPSTDANIAPRHCRIYALLGYFWLLDGCSPAGTYVQQHAGSEPWVVESGTDKAVHLMVGTTPVTLMLN